MIAIGIVAALLMNGLVFPRHCRVVFLSDTARTLGLLSQLYMTLSQCVASIYSVILTYADASGSHIFRAQPALAHDDKRKTLKMELQIRYNLYLLSALITTMHDEISLVPVSGSRCPYAQNSAQAIYSETPRPLSQDGQHHAEAAR